MKSICLTEECLDVESCHDAMTQRQDVTWINKDRHSHVLGELKQALWMGNTIKNVAETSLPPNRKCLSAQPNNYFSTS